MLFWGTSTIIHDNLYTEITGFHFLAENLLNGNIPLWDPYSFGGQPFAPLMLQLRLLDPINWVVIFVGSVFTRDTVILFHWSRFVMMWFSLLGGYVCFRAEAKTFLGRASLLSVLLLSSMMYGNFRQPGLLHHFAWVPWFIFFGRRLWFQRDHRWRNVIGFSYSWGVTWQSYFFASSWLWLVLILFWALLFHRDSLKLTGKKWFAIFAMAVAMAGPNFAVWLQEYDFIYPLRMVVTSPEGPHPQWSGLDHEGETNHFIARGVKVPYSVMVPSGFHGTTWDLVQHLLVDRAMWVNEGPSVLRRIYHDAAGFLGIATWVIAVFGIFAAKSAEKKFWLMALGFWGLLFLGPNAFLHEWVVRFYPPASYCRHSGYYLHHAQFAFLYFFVLGLEKILQFPAMQSVWYRSALTLNPIAKFRVWGRWVWEHAWSVVLPSLIVAVHLAALFAIVPEKLAILIRWGVVLGGAGGLLVLIGALGAEDRGLRSRSYRWLGQGLFLILLVGDLFLELKAASPFYAHHPHPSVVNSFETHVQPMKFPDRRKAYPEQRRLTEHMQFIRGIPFWERIPSALATPSDGTAKDFTEALKKPRNNSYYQLVPWYLTVHSRIPPRAMERLLGVGESALQFRSRAVAMPVSRIEPHFSELGDWRGREWLSQNVILPESETGASFPSGEFSGNVKSYRHGAVALETHSQYPGFLLWQDGFHRGWRALVDQKPVKVMRANGVFKAIFLPAGTHQVLFFYFPWGFVLGLLGWGAATFLAACVWGSVAIGNCWVRKDQPIRAGELSY